MSASSLQAAHMLVKLDPIPQGSNVFSHHLLCFNYMTFLLIIKLAPAMGTAPNGTDLMMITDTIGFSFQ